MINDDISQAQPTKPERLIADLSVIGIALLCIVITMTVVSRWLYRGIIPDDVLIVRELMVAVILLPLAAVSARRAQIEVTIFTEHVRGRGKAALSAFGNLAGVFFISILFAAGLRLFLGSWESGDYHDGTFYIPMWLANGVYVIGLTAFLLRLAGNLAVDLRDLVRGAN